MTGGVEGRVALVTGAGRGIGRATALRLARDGWDLALLALEEEEVEDTALQVRACGRRAAAHAVDVADPGALHVAVDAATRAMGPVSALVNVAGTIQLPDDAAHASVATWDRTMHVNARAPYLLAAAVLPGMQQARFGRIVTVASTAGLRGLPHRLAYVASKHAVVGFTRALAAEVRTPGVTVNAVCPGAVRTRMTMGSRPDADRTGWLDPEDVAATLAMVVGPDGAHLHGSVIEVGDRS